MPNELKAYSPMIYQIKLKGQLDSRWATRFEPSTISLDDHGYTLLNCELSDQSALYGLLRKVRDLGMPLISVQWLNNTSLEPEPKQQ